jgi:hypothetical protein
MKYICEDCYYLCKNPIFLREDHGLDSPPYEETTGCPRCGGNLIDVRVCDNCGDYITGDYIQISTGECYCENCFALKTI